MKRKLILLASVLFLTVISVPSTLKADIMDPPPNCGNNPGNCPPHVALQLGR
ncbi:MAG: hypothetical protein WB952_22005 [Terriglobales bacterium]